MSYTKFNKDVEKWLRRNNLQFVIKEYDRPEEIEIKVNAWNMGIENVLEEWINDKRYKELISCANSEWYEKERIFNYLKWYFWENNLIDEFNVLYQKNIRFHVNSMIFYIKNAWEGGMEIYPQDIINFRSCGYDLSSRYKMEKEIAEHRLNAINSLEEYIEKIKTIDGLGDIVKALENLMVNVESVTLKQDSAHFLKSRLSSYNENLEK